MRLVLLLLSLPTILIGQYKYPLKENIALANKLIKRFPDNKVVTLKSTSTINFELSYSNDFKIPVVSYTIDKEYETIACADNVTAKLIESYDLESTIENLRVKWIYNNNCGPITAHFIDEAYEIDGIFHSDIKFKSYDIKHNHLGDMLGVKYRQTGRDIRYLSPINLESIFPAISNEVKVIVPDWLDAIPVIFNVKNEKLIKTVTKNTKNNTTEYLYKLDSLDAFINTDFSPPYCLSSPYIVLHAKSFQVKGKKHQIFENVNDLYLWMKEINDKTDNQQAKLQSLASEITKDNTDKEEIIKALYFWVQDHIRYIAFEYGIAGYKSESAYTVAMNKYGDCKGMANLLVHLLRIKGFDAHLTWLGTRNSTCLDYSIPSLSIDNHAVCALFYNNKVYYLDATEKFIDLDYNAYRLQGRDVLVSMPDKYKILKIADNPASDNLEQYTYLATINGEKFIGNGHCVYNHESKYDISYEADRTNSSTHEETITKQLNFARNNLIIKNIKHSNLQSREKNLEVNFDFELKNKITKISDNQIYIDLVFNKVFSNLTDNITKSGLQFTRKHHVQIATIIDTKGYNVQNMPEPVIIETEDFIVRLNATYSNDQIKVSQEIIFPKGIISESNISKWKSAQKSINIFYENNVSLTKN